MTQKMANFGDIMEVEQWADYEVGLRVLYGLMASSRYVTSTQRFNIVEMD